MKDLRHFAVIFFSICMFVLAVIALVAKYSSGAEPIYPYTNVAFRCQKSGVNLQGASNADITIDNTAGGITVMAANYQSTTQPLSGRCGASIKNETGGGAIRCGPVTMTVTTTAGFFLAAGDVLNLGPEGQEAWKCIRTTASSGTVSVIEAIP